ncbi:hypothetical protein [Sinomonas sp. ASV322]|uniref:hypothetical protein n=1 Tax=Sinomonas sp. ASV322 TaxID=3041920 RepID=UPI0027DDF1CB|nr:hypothetical protein [Sinomonas sp. ASV322]MDQ4503943.1 hypothetical protein [Sinomonas sp. ASV322]
MRMPFRLSRAVTVSAMTVFLAASAHVAAGGVLPDPLIVAGLFSLVLVPVIALSRRKISAAAMLAILISGQFVLHEAFDALSISATSLPELSAAHVHVLGGAAQAVAGHVHADGLLMILAHTAATVLTGMVLAKGEAALWALHAWLRPLVRVLTAVAPHPTPVVPAFTEEAAPGPWPGTRLPSRRGPPAAFAVA